MYVTNVYDNYIQFNGKPFNVMEYESRGGKFKLCEVDDLAEFVDFPLNKILTTSDPEYLQAHYQEMEAPVKDTLSCMFTGPFYFEFTAQGIDKAKALDTVLKPMGYKQEEMMAFGDGHNDASMKMCIRDRLTIKNMIKRTFKNRMFFLSTFMNFIVNNVEYLFRCQYQIYVLLVNQVVLEYMI